MFLQWNQKAWNDYLYWQDQDKKTVKKINTLVKDIMRDPESLHGIGNPEELKRNLSGFMSRRIDDVNRLVYSVSDDVVLVISCRGHYFV